MKKPVRVTDHAVLRYLERVGGFDIETLRQNMARRIERPAELGVHAVIVDGHRFVVKAAVTEIIVVTVLGKGDQSTYGPRE